MKISVNFLSMILEMDDNELASPLQPWLVVIFPAELKNEIAMGAGPLVIGRSAHQANLVIDDDWISRRHCRLYWENGEIKVEDLGSTNGTFIDGIKVDHSVLSINNKLQLGKVILKLEMRKSTSSATPKLPISPPPLPKESLKAEADEFLAQAARQNFSVGALEIELTGEALEKEDVLEFIMGEIGEILRRELLSDDLLGELAPNLFLLLTSDISEEQLATFADTLRSWINGQRFIFESVPIELRPKMSVLHFPKAPATLEELLQKFSN